MIAITLVLPAAITIIGASVEGSADMWSYSWLEAQILLSLVTIFVVVVSADSVAGEFSSGTIKLLLIRPWSRSKILLSKYISLLLFALLLTVLLFGFTLLLNWAVFGSGAPEQFQNQGDMSHFAYMAALYGYEFIGLIITVTMAFMISTVFRSGGLAIGLSIFLLLSGSMIASLFLLFDKPWVDYVLFLHMGLSQHLTGTPIIEGGTLGFSLAVLAVYYAIFIALTWYVFNKRDVAA